MHYRFDPNITPEQLDTFAESYPYSPLTQSSGWATIKEALWEAHYLGVFADDRLVMSALVLIRRLPLGLRFAYCPRGPLMDYQNEELVTFAMKSLKSWTKNKHCLFLKFDPKVCLRSFHLADKDEAPILETGMRAIHLLEANGCYHHPLSKQMHDAFQPRFVACTHARSDLEATLPKRTRRFLADARRHHVRVVRRGPEGLDDFMSVIRKTEERKAIHLRNRAYFEKLMHVYGDRAELIFAEVNLDENLRNYQVSQQEAVDALVQLRPDARKRRRQLEDQIAAYDRMIKEIQEHEQVPQPMVLSGMLSVRFGDTMEHLYAGFDRTFRKYMPQYLIYVDSMQQAFAQGAKYCDMGGVEGTLDDGLTEFKDHFDPHYHEFIGEFDLKCSWLYSFFNLAWKIRKKIH